MHAPSINSRNKRKRRFQRTADGAYIIEILVALIIGAMFAFALGNSLGESLRLASSSQNEAYANSIIENLLECSRRIDYSELSKLNGQSFDIGDANEIQTSFAIHQFPMLLDLTNTWDRIKSSKFKGSVNFRVGDGPETGSSLLVSITVKWSDSWNVGQRTISRSIIRVPFVNG